MSKTIKNKKVLIFHTAFLGDIVLSTVLIDLIKLKNNNTDIYFLSNPLGCKVLKDIKEIKEIILFDKKGKDKGIKGIFKLVDVLKRFKFDEVIIPHRYMRSNIICFLAKIPIRIGYKNSELSFLLTTKKDYLKNEHETLRLANLLEVKSKEKIKMKLTSNRSDDTKMKEIIKKSYTNYEKIIVIAPGSKWKTKMWPIDYFNNLIEMLLTNKRNLMVIIGGKEESVLKINQNEQILNLIGKTTIGELKSIIKISDLVISNDSSPIHIACAFEKKVIGIFGATTKELGFFPITKDSVVIENSDLSCRPCGLHGGNICPKKHFKCMLEIKPLMVYEKVNELLDY